MELVPGHLIRYAEKRQAGVILTDYYLARRKRIHLGFIPGTEKQTESVDLDEVLDWMHEQEVITVLFVGGTRRSPAVYWISRLRPVTWRDTR